MAYKEIRALTKSPAARAKRFVQTRTGTAAVARTSRKQRKFTSATNPAKGVSTLGSEGS